MRSWSHCCSRAFQHLRRGAKACYRRGQDLKAEATRDQELIKLLLFGQRAQGLSQGAEGLSQRQEDEELREQWLREIGSEDLGGQGSEGLREFGAEGPRV
mmetsp:Transcript_27829/g.43445  ORF Transcript_27829/g.43445 Transcript_27829/m.43445 type:complete len:100 (+) Transcript_27829:836-1135(+)